MRKVIMIKENYECVDVTDQISEYTDDEMLRLIRELKIDDRTDLIVSDDRERRIDYYTVNESVDTIENCTELKILCELCDQLRVVEDTCTDFLLFS